MPEQSMEHSRSDDSQVVISVKKDHEHDDISQEEEAADPSEMIWSFIRKQKESRDFSLSEELNFWNSLQGNGSCSSPTSEHSSEISQDSNTFTGHVEVGIGNSQEMRLRKSRFLEPPETCFDLLEDITPEQLRSIDREEAIRLLRRSAVLKKSKALDGIELKKSKALDGIELKKSKALDGIQEEDDPFKSTDIPVKFRRLEWSTLSYLQWVAFMFIIGGFICTMTISWLQGRFFLGLRLWRWSVLILVLFCGRLLSGWMVRMIMFFVERNFILRKRVLYFVYGLRKGMQNCLWVALVLLCWNFVIGTDVTNIPGEMKTIKVLTKLLICFLIATLLWLIKILLVKVLALSFHVNTYFDRIQESLFHQYILEALSGPPLPEADKFSAKKSGAIGATGITIEELQKFNHRNVSAWNMKRMMALVRRVGLSTLSQTIDEAEGEEHEIRSERQAKAAAKHIFDNVANPDFNCIRLADLLHFMGPEEASKAFMLFEGAAESGKITKQSLINWVVGVYRERRALSFSLNDTKTAVKKLHRVIDAVAWALILVIWLLVLGLATTQLLLLISSQFLLAVFMFGNTCKTIFEALVFLFVMHPFDVGDRCVVDGVQMIVEEMNILTTVFLRYDNEKIYYPNTVLATKPISNFYRSPDMGDAIDFSIHISTPTEKIDALKQEMAEYIDKHPDHWDTKFDLVVKEIEDMNRIRISLWFRHTINYQDIGEKWLRRSALLLHLKDSFHKLGIDYKLLPQEIQLATTTDAGANK